jgi:hypothetical protein
MQQIKITKRAEVTGGVPAASNDEYVPGSGGVKGKSIPVDYWLTGTLIQPITVGASVVVAREIRNGVEAPGIFQTSPVVEVTNDTFRTANSVYDYTYLTPEGKTVEFTV